MKAKVRVVWNFVSKPPARPMLKFPNGQSIIKDAVHDMRPEGYPRTVRVYCYGCKEYFDSWHHALWRHGMCKEKPKKKGGRR